MFDNSKYHANIAYKYRNTKLKLYNVLEDIKFNKVCLRNNITPNYVQVIIKNKSKAAQLAKIKAQKIWIQEEIHFLYAKTFVLNEQLLKLHHELFENLHYIQVENLMTNINTWLEAEIVKKQNIHQNKLDRLEKKNNTETCKPIYSNHKFFPRIINKTNIQFEQNEISLLEKGLNYCIPDNNLTNLLLETESSIQNMASQHQNQSRTLANHTIIKNLNKPKSKYIKNERNVAKKIFNKLEDSNATAVKADKGNTIVIINKNLHHRKILDFINSNNIKKLPKDPTQTYHKMIKSAINNSKLLTPEQKLHCRVIKPTAPKLHGQPKIHKDTEPIRPIVNSVNSPSHKLAKLLDKIIRNTVNLENNRSLKNTTDLVTKIQNIDCPDTHMLVSFDIKDLYTSIPIEETLTILQNNLKNSEHLVEEDTIQDIIRLTRLTLQQNYFEYNSEYYLQDKGLAMGSPLSSIMADIFLNYIENEIILEEDKNPFTRKIHYYHRYADDVLCLFNGNKRQISLFTKFLNKVHPNLQFTTEIENQGQINFLDLTIQREDNKHKFKIYRKPTTTDQVIHNTSNHPTSHKYAAFHSMVHRLLNTPLSNEDYNSELNVIKQIAQNNGYNPHIINKLIWKHKNKLKKDNRDRPNYITMTYHSKVNNSIHNIISKQGYNIAYRSKNSLKQFLQKVTKKTHANNEFEDTGVYKLKCASCPKYYIGQTGRSFKIRYKEHLPKNHNFNQSTYAEHLINENHNFSTITQDMEIIAKAPKSKRLDILEQYHIYKNTKLYPTDVLNDQINFQANIIFDSIINHNKQP